MEETYEKSIFDENIPVIYGGFWERFGALILDGIIMAPISILNYYNKQYWSNMLLSAVCTIILLAYKPLLEYLYSATPGKKALSLTIVNNGYDKIDFKEAVLRNIFGIVGSLLSFIISLNVSDKSFMSTGKVPADANLNAVMSAALPAFLYGFGIFVLYMADAICLMVNNKKQSLHDLIAKTYVIRKL